MVDPFVKSLPGIQAGEGTDTSSETESASISNKNPKPSIVPLLKSDKRVDPTQIRKRRKKPVTICLTNCRYDVIRRISSKYGFREVSEGDTWNMYWTDLSISIERCKDMKRYQKINHFPGMLEICRKDLLARNLNRMLRLFPKDYNFFPKTWCLPADLGEVLSYSRLRKNKTFILKPDAGSQGRGIMLTKNLREIKPSDRVICQVYLSNPFLIDGFKFDLRVYTLITSCDPLRIYIYEEGLCRFATSRYQHPSSINVSNVFMHLTNYAVNKHSRTYNINTERGSKRKLSWLNAYLRSMGHDVDQLWRRIDDVIIKTIVSAWPILKHSYSACFPNHDVIPACCELLGTDILLDKRMNPHILEVNHSPSFHTDTALDTEVKEALLNDMFAMLNLELCDKRKIMREDKKRVRERLLHGMNKDAPNMNDGRNFTEYYRQEMNNRGNFRLVYPLPTTDQTYSKFFNQGQGSIYCDTAASRARENAQTALRDEMQLKAKLEASKRVSAKPTVPVIKPTRPETPRSKYSISMTRVFGKGSFEPQMIVEAEEKERLHRLAQRDYLVRSNGLLEHIYFGLKKNGVLRPQDERKFSIFDKIRSEPSTALRGPAIVDLLEGIRDRGNLASKFDRQISLNISSRNQKLASFSGTNRNNNDKSDKKPD